MSNVYKHQPMATDPLVGHVNPDGAVYRSQFGPDEYVGRVEVETGHVYRQVRMGPDTYVGHVDLQTGQVFRQVPLGPDEHVGHVDGQGRLYRQRQLAPDDYVGHIQDMQSYADAGAALLLLLAEPADE